MINLTINGQKVEVEEGNSLLQAAEKLGIKIPTLCSHKALPAYGACRLCLVEVSQPGRPPSIQASCTYPAQEGLVVKTDTERVIKTRKIMVELLLARCPDSEEVKRLAEEMGVGKPRIKPKNEDCLLCGLCVRMCHNRMGRGAIGFAYRGSKREVVPAFDVTSDVCQTCGACFSICPMQSIKFEEITKNKPVPIPSEFDRGLRERPAIYISFPQAVPNYATIDKEHCVHLQTGECKICQEFCEADAINFDQKEQRLKLNVGAIVAAPGYDIFDPAVKTALGYKKYPDVLTSAEFERILSPSGPYEGHIQRPSDGTTPKRIAFIQCVGSRDNTPDAYAPYCSSVCCMHSIKEAIIAKEHVRNIEPTIFFMDIRAQGKDFDKYYERAKDEYGVKFIRSKVDRIEGQSEIRNPNDENEKSIEKTKSSENLMVYYTTDDGKQSTSEFDLVVLAVGFRPPEGILELSDKLKIRLNKYNFLRTPPLSPVETTREGIFACGVALAPKDIPETVGQASGAAAGAAELLSDVRGTEIIEKTYPPERDVSGQSPRIGVFVCHCGINIGAIVDVPKVVEYAKTLPNVVHAEDNLFTCSQDTQEKIKQMIEEHNLNRVVVASCSPRTHEPLFQETLRESGLNPRLFEMANIRDQCSWVHMHEPVRATEKAKTLVQMAVTKASLLEPLSTVQLDVIQKGLVIGGGLAGMVSALSIAEQGFEVSLVEKENELGGNLRNLYYTIEGDDVQEYLNSLIEEIEGHPKIKVYKETSIENIEGYIGNYKTTLTTHHSPLTTHQIDHGIVVVATGAEESKPKEYLYGEDERVITQLELEKRLSVISDQLSVKSPKRKAKSGNRLPITDYRLPKTVVMIQCVGSRDDEHPYCSRVCCQEAIKNALKLRQLNQKANIYILYRDIRTYGFLEEYYQQARDNGILFIRYDKEEKPIVTIKTDDKLIRKQVDKKTTEGTYQPNLVVKVKDPILNRQIVINPDLVVLAPAIVPRSDALNISQLLKVPLNEDNFFLEAHVKLRPVDFATEGIFLAGLAHSPKTIDESISQAKAAAARACTIISKDKYTAEAAIASVNEDVCAGCGVCESICVYDAPKVVVKDGRRVSVVNKALCKGCGSCACACPSGAIEHLGFKSQQTLAMVNTALLK